MDQAVTVWRDQRAGRIRLDRPKALNALDLAMVVRLQAALDDFRDDPAVHVVMIEGNARAFCAGGDIRALQTHLATDKAAPVEQFFSAEYALNEAIARFPKPYIALIDGVCMGGGIGISVHGSHRVVTEAALFAMPETGIGLFPDIGASFLLPRLPGRLGFYLGLTGARLQGGDAVHAGLGTQLVARDALPRLAAAIAQDGAATVATYAAPLPPYSLAPHRALIDRVFGLPSVAEIMTALAATPGDFAAGTLAALRAASPSALLWSFALLTAGAGRTLHECLTAELTLVVRITQLPEFQEGVRAQLIDKDRAPRWQPARLQDVDPAWIASLLAP